MKKQKYSPQITQPYYSDKRQAGAVLHRYLDDQFLMRFTQQAQANQLSKTEHSWLDEDRFVKKDKPCLRLPVHRTFYIVCCEAICNAPGQAAFDVSRIESAGFVIRQQADNGQELRWMVNDGIDKGWGTPTNTVIEEPDDYRYLLSQGYTEKRSPEPAYSGEQTYPLSPIQVSDNGRKHSLLYGFVPLGGQSYPSASVVAKPCLKDCFMAQELSWPLGSFIKPLSTGEDAPLPQWVENSSEHSGHLIQDGKIGQAAAELLVMLFERYHLVDDPNKDNVELIALLNNISLHFGNGEGVAKQKEVKYYQEGESLYQYLSANKISIENWLTEYHIADGSAELANTAFIKKADEQSNNTENYFIPATLQLFITEKNAQNFQLILARRSLGVVEIALSDLPEPRYQRESSYYVKTFLRYRDAKGCLKIIWGTSTIPFYVAAPFDPDASRPHLIQMPELKDLTKGLANGAALKVPKSLADIIERIKPDLAEPEDKGNENRTKSGWMYIFSIPILTICAMILLMIVVNLLNFIFRWIPWVILRIPIP